MSFAISQGLEKVESTVCLVCKDDYGDIADECLSAGVCEDCHDTCSIEEILEAALNINEAIVGQAA
jgi:hypothetical protein